MPDCISPNQGARRDGLIPVIIVLHYTAMESAEAAKARLCDPASQVSAHYLIDRSGQTICLVPEDRRAWHAGVGEWQGKDDINSRSIGIELDNDGCSPFAAPLMDALETLLQDIRTRWAIPSQNVIGHEDMSPGRKIDPGPRFDWARLQRSGLSVHLDYAPAPALFQSCFDEEECADLLFQIGYTADAAVSDKLRSFRNRFLPVSRGGPNEADRAMMVQYLNDFGSASLG